MTRETPGTSGLHLCRDSPRANAVSRNRVASERNGNNVCLQTGEEFSSEFLRDRVNLRRIAVINDGNHHHPIQMGVNLIQNHQLMCEDHSRIVGLRRKDVECNADVSDFACAAGYVAEVENKIYPDNISRYQWQYDAIGQNSGKFSDESNSDQLTAEPLASPIYVVDSPQSFHPYGPGFAEGPFIGKMKLLCSFGGRILPRPSDGKLRYVGGETRIISIRKNHTWEELMRKTSAICNHPHTIKYQLPGEDLDALISVCSDEDLHHMIEEYHELEKVGGSQRLRIFLVSSVEPESPCSLDGRSIQQADADNQYVSAVNGILDGSPRRSSSGQSLASQSTQLGRDSPTSAHTCENKDYSPNSPNFGGMFLNRGTQFLPAIHVPGKTVNPSPPISPLPSHHRDPVNSNVQYFIDQPCDASGSASPSVMDKFPCDQSYFVNSPSHYDNLAPSPLPMMNYHQHNQCLVETEQTNKCHEMHFHNHKPSKDFVLHLPYDQGEMNSIIPILKEKVHSDLRLQEHDDNSTHCLVQEIISPIQRNIGREKSPLLALSNSSLELAMQLEEVIDEKHQGTTTYEIQPSLKTRESSKNNFVHCQKLKWTDGNPACYDPDRKYIAETNKVTLIDNTTGNKMQCQPSSQRPLRDSPDSGSSLFSLHLATSEGPLREHLHDYQLDTTLSEYHVKSPNVSKDGKYTMTETSQPDSQGSPALLSVSSGEVGSQEYIKPTTVSIFSCKCNISLNYCVY